MVGPYAGKAPLGAPPGAAGGQRASCRVYAVTARRTIQLLGVVACACFAVQGIHLWAHRTSTGDVWETHYFIGELSLFLIASLSGCYLEACIFLPDVVRSRWRFASNRLLLACGYLWLGCYSMGGYALENDEGWRSIFGITGILAWVVCLGNVFIARCSDHEDTLPPDEGENWPDVTQPQDVGYCRCCGRCRGMDENFCPACGVRLKGDGGPVGPPVIGSPAGHLLMSIPSGAPREGANPFAQDALAFVVLTARDSPPASEGGGTPHPAEGNPFAHEALASECSTAYQSLQGDQEPEHDGPSSCSGDSSSEVNPFAPGTPASGGSTNHQGQPGMQEAGTPAAECGGSPAEANPFAQDVPAAVDVATHQGPSAHGDGTHASGSGEGPVGEPPRPPDTSTSMAPPPLEQPTTPPGPTGHATGPLEPGSFAL